MHPNWQPPTNYQQRPVAVIGAGVLGRRIACIWASAGYPVNIRDPSLQQRQDALAYVEENVAQYAKKTGKQHSDAMAFESLADAVANAWLIIEAVPEKIQLKIDTFADLEALAPVDCILASNSSSYKSSEMLGKASESTKARILNMHYYMPPGCMIVELMTDGYTHEEIFPFMVERSKEAATLPYVARKESTGFIFNRLWAAVKRETLTILAEGVSVPEEIDSLWEEMFVKTANRPCRLMDDIGLDTVAFIEQHYVNERGLSSEKTVDYLEKNYLNKGKLGTKCSQGGLYSPEDKQRLTTSTPSTSSTSPSILALDIGLSSSDPGIQKGQILELTADGKLQRTLAKNLPLPDGLVVDKASDRMFWTCMGSMGNHDGSIHSSRLDGSDARVIVPQGITHTPKQMALDTTSQQLYFSDREGLRVFRCKTDGSDVEVLIENGDHTKPQDTQDATKWCVGIAVAPKLGKFYWTQKGPSKGGKGSIFSADITTPEGHTVTSRSDIQCVLSNLPEPIDLEIDEESLTLYWTDRGELPNGNSLNRIKVDEFGQALPNMHSLGYEVVVRNLHEAIGLKLDTENDCVYLSDLGGHIYRCSLDGKRKEVLHYDDNRAFTGLTLV